MGTEIYFTKIRDFGSRKGYHFQGTWPQFVQNLDIAIHCLDKSLSSGYVLGKLIYCTIHWIRYLSGPSCYPSDKSLSSGYVLGKPMLLYYPLDKIFMWWIALSTFWTTEA